MTTTNRPQALISATTRAAAAFAVVALVSAACITAAHESRQAVQEGAAAMSRTATIYVTLPTVEIVAGRQAADPVTTAAVRHTAKSL
jgi:hypothetical protein